MCYAYEMEVDFKAIMEKATFFQDPFPHWVAYDALDSKILHSVLAEYPTSSEIHEILLKNGQVSNPYNQNTAYPLEFADVESSRLTLKAFSESWVDQRIEILELIKSNLPKHVQDEFEYVKQVSFSRGDFRSSSPVTVEGTSQLGPHLDNPFEILAGLIYLRQENDESSGGHLQVYNLNSNAPKKYMSIKRRVPLKYLTLLKDIPYQENVAFFFLSHPRAIHGIAPRGLTKFDRRVINISIELPESQEIKMFNSEDLTDFRLTGDSNPKTLSGKAKIYYRKFRGKVLRRESKSSEKFGKYDWIEAKNL